MNDALANVLRSFVLRYGEYSKYCRLLRSILPPDEITYADCRFLTHLADNYTEFQLWLNGRPPEHDAIVYLRNMFLGSDITMIDVGANAGVFSLPIARVAAPNSKFILFEPNPLMHERIVKNSKLNRFSGVHIMKNAISDENADLLLHFPDNGNLGQARLKIPYKSPQDEAISVPARTLPSCLLELAIKEVNLLKVDIEGLEDRAIIPLLRAESAPKPDLIFFEDAHRDLWKDDLVAVLTSTGYSVLKRFGPNALYQRV